MQREAYICTPLLSCPLPPRSFWYTPGTRPGDNEPYAVFLQSFSALPDSQLPKVLSTSYGASLD